MNILTFNMSFYMSNRSMYTIDAIRHGIRTATTRVYPSEIKLIKSLKVGQPIRFVRTENKQIVDSIIVFVGSTDLSQNSNWVWVKLHNNMFNDDIPQTVYKQSIESYWLNVEGWDREFAKGFFKSNRDKEIIHFRYSLYPTTYNNYSPDVINELKENEVFTFGANQEGRHGLGAAKLAVNKFGAIYGQAEGLQGQSYGLITTDLNKSYRPSVSIELLTEQVNKFIQFAKDNPHLTFLVTEVGCGLAGFTVEQVAPLFKAVLLQNINNVRLPKKFVRELIVNSINNIL